MFHTINLHKQSKQTLLVKKFFLCASSYATCYLKSVFCYILIFFPRLSLCHDLGVYESLGFNEIVGGLPDN